MSELLMIAYRALLLLRASPLPALRGLIGRSLELGGFTAPRPLSSRPDVEGSHFPLNYLSRNQKR